MTKNELVKAMAEKSDGLLTQREVTLALECLSMVVTEVVKAEDSVKVGNFVTISGVHKDARVARNPADGSSVNVPARTAPKAKFSSNFKTAIND